MQTVQEIVRTAKDGYTDGGETHAGKYVDISQYEIIETIYAYLNSKHISGLTDAKGREKPFFNIVTAAVNIWYRATDIDRKNIRIKATKNSQIIPSFIATVHLQNWMKTAKFGAFLNKWGRTQAQYGSAVTKFVETNGELIATVIPWNRIICDTVDFESNPVIERLQFTPAQLRQNKSYDQEMVEQLIDSVSAREGLDDQDVDDNNNYIEVYEVHGDMPLSYLTGKEKDEKTYRQQMQVVSFTASKEKGEFDDYTLFSGKEAKSPYLLTHLIEEDNRTLSIGAVEYLFDAQWMKNHTIKATKDHLDLVAKQVYQTSDGSFIGNNVTENVETGDILIHKPNEPLTTLAHNQAASTELSNFGKEWEEGGKELTNTPGAERGDTMPSGTAYRQVAILKQSSGSLFELMTENRGLSVEDMMRIFILPFIEKKMNTADEVAATLEANDIKFIDSIYIPQEAVRRSNAQFKDRVLNRQPQQPLDLQGQEQAIGEELAQQGDQRFFKPSEISDKTWKDVLKDFGDTVTVEVTNENIDKEQMFTTLTSLLREINQNPAVLNDPNAKTLFNRILEETGRFSPLELAQNTAQPQNGQPKVGGAKELQDLAAVEKDKQII